MEYAEGKKLTCCGDEPYNECEQKYAKNSTWLLHEAFCLFSQADKFKPYEKHHSTVKDACELAQKLEAENLILYHTEDKNISRRKELYTEEGRQYYKGNLWIPDDLKSTNYKKTNLRRLAFLQQSFKCIIYEGCIVIMLYGPHVFWCRKTKFHM